jgi:hypothetical protein
MPSNTHAHNTVARDVTHTCRRLQQCSSGTKGWGRVCIQRAVQPGGVLPRCSGCTPQNPATGATSPAATPSVLSPTSSQQQQAWQPGAPTTSGHGRRIGAALHSSLPCHRCSASLQQTSRQVWPAGNRLWARPATATHNTHKNITPWETQRHALPAPCLCSSMVALQGLAARLSQFTTACCCLSPAALGRLATALAPLLRCGARQLVVT